MAAITNRVSLTDARDLLDGTRRACLSFVVDGRPRVEPVIVDYGDDRFLVAIPAGAAAPTPGAEVVLVVDEGVLFFDLRAVYVRGTTTVDHRPPGADNGRAGGRDNDNWLELTPTRVTCWDYGKLRRDREHG